MSDATANKKLVHDFYESYNAKNLDDSWKRFIATNLVNHALGGAYDGNAWREMDKGLFGAFADFSLQVLDQIAEGDKVATRYTLGGTHTGAFAGIPASGVVTRLSATAVDRVVNGKIVEHWVDLDLTGFMQTLAQPPKSPASDAPHPTELDEMKKVVARWVDVVNSGTLEGIESVWAEDCVVHAGGGMPDVRGVVSLGRLLSAYRAALTNIHITTESLVAEGDRVAARFTTRGRHDGALLDIPATGASIEIGGFGLFRIERGRIAEEWLLDDLAAFMAQANAQRARPENP